MAPQYKETLFSKLYPGHQHSSPTYIPLLHHLHTFVPWTAEQRQKVVIRSDRGFGSDDNIDEALDLAWQVLTKAGGGRRPGAYAKRLTATDWLEVSHNHWLAPIPFAPVYSRPTRTWLLKWLDPKGKPKLATLVCSVLDWTAQEVMAHYDDRGQCEKEIQADKQGLRLCQRRKHQLTAQEALVILTNVAHNLVAWSLRWMALEKPLHQVGTTRLIEDVFTIPGHLHFDGERLAAVQLNERHPYAQLVADGLRRLLAHFGNP